MEALDANGDSVLPRARKTRALLAVIALAAPRPVPRVRLAAMLWATRDKEQARGSLRQALHELQQALGPDLGTLVWADRSQIGMVTDGVWLDVNDAPVEPVARLTDADPPAPLLLSDLEDLDPGFDAWLAEERDRVAGNLPPDEPAIGAGWTATQAAEAPAAEAPDAAVRRTGRLRLGVISLRALGGPQDDPFALGLTEEVAVALARVRWISCITGTALGPSASGPHDAGEWRRLGLDILLDGTVQRSGNRVRITLQLLDMREGGTAFWSRRFDHASDDLIRLQEEIAGQAVAQIDSALLMREGDRVRALPPSPNATADELTLRAVPSVYRLAEAEFAAAGGMLRLAVTRDPGHAAAHAWLAYWNLFLVGQGWAEAPQLASEEAGVLADRAVALEPEDAHFITLSGHVRSFLAKRPREGIALHQHAINLNPNLPMAWAFLGLAQTYLGAHDEGLVSIEQARRLSPVDPHSFFFDMALTMPHLLKRNHAAAAEIGRRAIQLNPAFSSAYKGFLAALGHLGMTSEAEDVRARLMRIEPRLTLADAVRRSPMLRAEDVAHYAEGLRLAGLT
ncbi:MAG: hypothetical protein JSR21_09270 [Proteobacteria bacterium]|nr:hypothetical protein [Pseudomonadota bacterium]